MMKMMIAVVCILFTPEKQDLNIFDDRCHTIQIEEEEPLLDLER